ncbi:Mediator of RNA polymerase II transcription subunit 4 [Lamellibrachia satsuma]|nr:Mediator of RNA polymerase II transcription subunit 4 [Lamellibrachia satsuma]
MNDDTSVSPQMSTTTILVSATVSTRFTKSESGTLLLHRTDLEGFLVKAFLAVGRRCIAMGDNRRVRVIVAVTKSICLWRFGSNIDLRWELFELMSTAKQQRGDSVDSSQLIELLVHKDKELHATLQTAQQQAETEKKLQSLKAEVERRDQDIRLLQTNLKDAEDILAVAIYQAKQKLNASNAVAAPATWAPGDPRRPYPTDMDMRHGLLGHLSDQSQGTFTDTMATGRIQSHMEHSISTATPQQSTLSWQPGMDSCGSSMAQQQVEPAQHSSATMDSTKGHKESEDVELMSSDTSSSSSSDE